MIGLTSRESLLWAEALVVWAIANYSIVDSSFEISDAAATEGPPLRRSSWPIVRLVAAIIAAIIVGWLAASWSLGLLFAICAIPLVVLRARWADWCMAEREVLLSATFATGSLALIANAGLEVHHSLVTVDMSGDRVAVACIARLCWRSPCREAPTWSGRSSGPVACPCLTTPQANNRQSPSS